MTLGSLFSGIGGLDLGLERAGFTVKWQVEVDPYARRILERHWPGVHRRSDIRLCDATTLAPVDCIAGGFPCQDLSTAGRGAGITGRRSGLWGDFGRLVGELQPRWVVVENIGQGWRRWVPFVRRDLSALGYASVPLRLSAAELGADHIRTRVFVVAHADSQHVRDVSRWWAGPRGEVAAEPLDARWGTARSRVARRADGVSRRLAVKGLGNAVVPQVAEEIGRSILRVAG